MEKINNYGFLASSCVKVFPCAYRGYQIDGTTIFDPESKLNTEATLTKNGSSISDLTTSYILSWTPSLLRCVLAGYTFELNVGPQDFDKPGFADKDIYIKIIIEQRDLIDHTNKTAVLCSQSFVKDSDLDNPLEGPANDYYFTGLTFVPCTAGTVDNLLSEEGTVAEGVYTLRVLTADGNPDKANFLPHIATGAGEDSIILNKRMINPQNNLDDPKNYNILDIQNIVKGNNSTAINNGVIVGNNSIAANNSNVLSDSSAGFGDAKVAGEKAFGANKAKASGKYSAAFNLGEAGEPEDKTLGWGATALNYSSAYGNCSLSCGGFVNPEDPNDFSFTLAGGNSSFAGGYSALATGVSAFAFGGKNYYITESGEHLDGWIDTEASGDYSVAFGRGAKATGEASTAFGMATTSKGAFSLVGGNNSNANGENSFAFGNEVTVDQANAVGMGYNIHLIKGKENANSIALGSDLSSNKSDTILLGHSLEAGSAKQVVLGYKNTKELLDDGYPIVTVGGGSDSEEYTQVDIFGVDAKYASSERPLVYLDNHNIKLLADTKDTSNDAISNSFKIEFTQHRVPGSKAAEKVTVKPLYKSANRVKIDAMKEIVDTDIELASNNTYVLGYDNEISFKGLESSIILGDNNSLKKDNVLSSFDSNIILSGRYLNNEMYRQRSNTLFPGYHKTSNIVLLGSGNDTLLQSTVLAVGNGLGNYPLDSSGNKLYNRGVLRRNILELASPNSKPTLFTNNLSIATAKEVADYYENSQNKLVYKLTVKDRPGETYVYTGRDMLVYIPNSTSESDDAHSALCYIYKYKNTRGGEDKYVYSLARDAAGIKNYTVTENIPSPIFEFIADPDVKLPKYNKGLRVDTISTVPFTTLGSISLDVPEIWTEKVDTLEIHLGKDQTKLAAYDFSCDIGESFAQFCYQGTDMDGSTEGVEQSALTLGPTGINFVNPNPGASDVTRVNIATEDNFGGGMFAGAFGLYFHTKYDEDGHPTGYMTPDTFGLGSGNIAMSANSEGMINVTNDSGSYTISLDGSDGSVTATSFDKASDIRLKENLVLFSASQAKTKSRSVKTKSILDLPIYIYNFKNDVAKDHSTTPKHIGCVAQELQEIFPELVVENKETHYLTIRESELVYPLIEEVKQLKSRIEILEQQIAKAK